MKIDILGKEEVGSTHENLLSQENDLTIVDDDPIKLHKLEEEADIKTILGSASYPNILVNAGINDADMVVAVTGSDETNIVSCLISKVLNGSVKTIARVREISYLKGKTKKAMESGEIPVDVHISPEQLITDHIEGLIEVPGSLQVMEFGQGQLNLVAVKAVEGGPMIGHEIADLKKHMPRVDLESPLFSGKVIQLFPLGKQKLCQRMRYSLSLKKERLQRLSMR